MNVVVLCVAYVTRLENKACVCDLLQTVLHIIAHNNQTKWFYTGIAMMKLGKHGVCVIERKRKRQRPSHKTKGSAFVMRERAYVCVCVCNARACVIRRWGWETPLCFDPLNNSQSPSPSLSLRFKAPSLIVERRIWAQRVASWTSIARKGRDIISNAPLTLDTRPASRFCCSSVFKVGYLYAFSSYPSSLYSQHNPVYRTITFTRM